ncbi:MAG: hypothetical protein JNL87_11685 [Burkholderiaceae bacterium]|nr:hypothetical protein [Burkholderiaceae bacterium]
MSYDDLDLFLGRQVIQQLVNLRANPPLMRLEYNVLARLHLKLISMGFKLTKREKIGPEAGFMLFYISSNVLVRIKTRGSGGRFRGGVPHMTISLLSGRRDQSGGIDTDYKAEEGKFHVGGGLVNNKTNKKSSIYNEKNNPRAKRNAEDWSDGTHFDFPDLYLDDECVQDLPIS